MALIRRQSADSENIDDQGPLLWGTYSDDWSWDIGGSEYYNGTYTDTSVPGASFSFTFSGIQARIYGPPTSAYTGVTPPDMTANYIVDGSDPLSQRPWVDSVTGRVLFFETEPLTYGTHKIDIIVISANETNTFCLDLITVYTTSGVETSSAATSSSPPTVTSSNSPTVWSSGLPTVATHSTSVGAIAGGVAGGVAGIAILVAVLWYFLRKTYRGPRANVDFQKSGPDDIFDDEYRVEPFDPINHTATSQTIGQAVVSPFLSQQNQSGPGDTTGISHVPGNTTRPTTRKATREAQQHQDVHQPVRHEDSGVRFDESEERETDPPRLPTELPPTYTPR